MDTVTIDGRRLDSLRRRLGRRQRNLAEKAAVTKFTLSRWCRDGLHRVKRENATALAGALGIPMEDLLAQAGGAAPGGDVADAMTAAEAEWLETYRRLAPLEQARVRVAVEEIIRGQASAAKPPR